ncbi:DUF6151 family protein [uncultured Pelagimonas sp.]|uniref:DUF6151 family protein n=1 Tax=uncultured Pelagimonas sp. TaxID=1618102 RepID=UPI0026107DB0|nr:DUF6151 family protein [uncultured Pelagimonas sp.]
MADKCSLNCRCGKVAWHIKQGAAGRHVMCYCVDCQCEPRHLGVEDGFLKNGGTQIFQTTPDQFVFDKGQEHLGVMRLSPKGLLRWYTTCCNTPIANTLPTPTMPFVGAVLPIGHDHYGRVSCHANTAAASSKVRQRGVPGAVYSMFWRAAKTALAGNAKVTPFFNDDKTPIVTPTVLTLDQRNTARPDTILR